MWRKKQSLYSMKSLLILLGFSGLLLGIVVANLFFKSYLDQVRSLITAYMKQFLSAKVNFQTLLFYLLRIRILPIILLAICGNTRWRNGAMSLYSAWIGFSAGMFVSLVTMESGPSGILLTLTALLPQYLLYIPATLLLLFGILRRERALEERGDCSHDRICYVLVVVVVCLLMILGIWLEACVNPGFAQKLLKNY